VNKYFIKSEQLSRGLFISFEGGDGTGKSTQAELFYEWAKRNFDKSTILTFEPGGSSFGQEIRQIVMHRKSKSSKDAITAKTQALLFAIDRSYHVDNVIWPALKAGKTVITDRYFDSSVAYQGQTVGLSDESIYNLNMFATNGLLPDITFLIDKNSVNALALAKQNTGTKYDRFETQDITFHNKIRQKYLDLAKDNSDKFNQINYNDKISSSEFNNKKLVDELNRWHIIDGKADIKRVHQSVIEEFLQFYDSLKAKLLVSDSGKANLSVD
jgi:dTMP kinase